MTFKHILVHDWETSGLPHESEFFAGGQGIQYAAILADAKTLATIDTLELNIRFEGHDGGSNLFPRFEWSEEAENIHGLSRSWLGENGIPLSEAGARFENFLSTRMDLDGKILTAGHNPSFDLHFTKQMMAAAGHSNRIRFHHRMIDTFSIGYTLLGAEDSNQLFEKIGVVRGKHGALEDAQSCLDVLRRVFMLRDILDEHAGITHRRNAEK